MQSAPVKVAVGLKTISPAGFTVAFESFDTQSSTAELQILGRAPATPSTHCITYKPAGGFVSEI